MYLRSMSFQSYNKEITIVNYMPMLLSFKKKAAIVQQLIIFLLDPYLSIPFWCLR